MLKNRVFLLIVLVITTLMLGIAPVSAQRPVVTTEPQFVPQPTDRWAVQVAPGTDVDALAASLGFFNFGPINGLDGWYLLRASGGRSDDMTRTISLRDAGGVLQVYPQFTRPVGPRGIENHITDPRYPNQWHIRNKGISGVGVGEDANVFGAWNFSPLCCNGTDVVVASVDDGLVGSHPDIAPNYRADLSYSYVYDTAQPWGTVNDGNHGTPVGGVMAGADDGASCGVGVAFRAGVAGAQIFSDIAGNTDQIEASALGSYPNEIDIYNNSWGPFDNGQLMEKPDTLAAAAIANGIANGRGGLGSIYVWAGGNGGNGDNSNADGYANSIYTIAVAASTDAGVRSWYSERGVNLLVNAPSNGGTRGIVTTARRGCTDSFGGTSSASPLVAGVIALMLEANPNLSWRDVQYILALTAEKNDPTHASWSQNAAGYWFSEVYGFGRVDAAKAVRYAAMWRGVPAKATATSLTQSGGSIPDGVGNPEFGAPLTRTYNLTSQGMLEHVELTISGLTHTYPGDLEIYLVSPSGTRSRMMTVRTADSTPRSGFNWTFMSNQFWGEPMQGTWTLEIRDYYSGDTGSISGWQLTTHYVAYQPHLLAGPTNVSGILNSTQDIEHVVIAPATTTYQWFETPSTSLSGQDSTTLNNIVVPATQSYFLRAVYNATNYDFSSVNVFGLVSLPLTENSDMSLIDTKDVRAPLGWKRLSAAPGDRQLCDIPTSNCFFQFVAQSGEKTQIRQYTHRPVAENALSLTFSLSAWRGNAAHNANSARMQLVVRYVGGGKSSCVRDFRGPVSPRTFSCTVNTTGAPILEVIASVINRTTTLKQRLRVDDLSVVASLAGLSRADNAQTDSPNLPLALPLPPQ